MIVVNRFRSGPDPTAGDAMRGGLQQALDALRERPGFVDGAVGRNVDEPELWLLTTRWENVGSYRRALSSYDVKLAAVPLLSQAIDEPSAYEVVPPGHAGLNEAIPRQLD
ncbi:MAG TPA: antibiotic biosynthesis monooxygenase family protein [Nocardioides sp.]|uniref:antibiotic biosynthesis monooxygenase family protein n=1 Tax=Nocardioides sp. TaxID=35761 RepID=UPI002D7FACCF|nr:antibiotic biosynthesis monooxygenase family protein [Nocardioides sp.]HET6654540.1 antibiotic biosynthesis monooxygenase family protein [Nocardioides sp.]